MARTPSSNREISLAAPCVLAVLVSIFVAQASLSAVALPMQESASHDQNAAPANQEEITELELGKSIERELSAGQKHRYQVKLSAGQFMKTEIRDHGTDVGVVIHFPNGDSLNPWLPVAEPFDVKPVSHLAETAGIYSLDVYASARAVTGRYEIRLTELRTANEDDRALQEARNLFRDYVRIRDQGRWIEAGPYLRRVLEIRERILGQQNLLVATTLGFMANHYDNTGNYANAESYGLRALTIKETLLGPDHPEVAHEYFSMSVIYRNRGDYSKTEELQHKGLAILEKAHKSQSPMAAALLEGLGSVRYELHDYQGAEEYTQQGRAIWEKLLGADNYHLAPSYTFLGRVAYDRADYAKAETMFQKALSLGETGLGKDHLKVTKYRNDLAMLYCTTGDYPRGEALYRQSLAVHEQKAAMSHPAVQETLFGLARCYAAQGNAPDALLIQSRASEMEERYVAVNLAVGSEREKQAFLASLSSRSWRNISLHTRVVPADPVARDLAITTVLQSKGRVQDAMSASLSGLRQHLSADDQKLLDRLNDVTAKLASLVLNGPQKLAAAEYQQQIKALEDQREGLEDEIHHRSAGFYAASKPVTLAAIQAAVPGEAALIEFAVYRPFDPRAANDQKAYGAPRYVAYVVRNQGPVQWAELGAAAPIDRSIDNLREALRDPHRKDVQRLARAVDAQIMQPVRALLGSAAQLLISPDGELNLIPFGALVDEQGHYLTERYFISYLTAGRDLLRMQVQRESKGAPVVIADPFFGDPRSVQVARSDVNYTRPIPSPSKRRSITAGDDLAAVYFAPLSGTAEEARVIESLFPGTRVLTGKEATKSALQQLTAPRILHIATHGFFLQGKSLKVATEAQAGTNRDLGHPILARIDNPLLRSGLALTGANVNKTGSEDGIITALEASNLNLWGTKLVTLSACDTGLGEVRNGEGVYGLRRAFFLSGAETLVMSMWPVSDQVTREMMVAYYTGLKQGLGRGEALHQAELAMMKRKGRQHPFYWASFIQAGEWANLDGKR